MWDAEIFEELILLKGNFNLKIVYNSRQSRIRRPVPLISFSNASVS